MISCKNQYRFVAQLSKLAFLLTVFFFVEIILRDQCSKAYLENWSLNQKKLFMQMIVAAILNQYLTHSQKRQSLFLCNYQLPRMTMNLTKDFLTIMFRSVIEVFQ